MGGAGGEIGRVRNVPIRGRAGRRRFPCRIVLAEVLLECLMRLERCPLTLYSPRFLLPVFGCLPMVTRDACVACVWSRATPMGRLRHPPVVLWYGGPNSPHPTTPNPLCNSSVVDRFAALRILPVSNLSTCYRRRLLIFRVLDLQATGGRGRGAHTQP